LSNIATGFLPFTGVLGGVEAPALLFGSPPTTSLRRACAVALVWLLSAPAGAEETTIEVRGPLSRQGSRDDIAASTVVSGEKLQTPGATSADVLAGVPGVQVSRTGSASDLSTAAIRGATSAQTPVYLAGVRLNDDLTGTADLSTIPLSLMRRVEVYRGSSPLDVDRAGIGGAVLFEPRLETRSRLGAGLTLGSFGEQSGFVMGSVAASHASSSLLLARDAAQNDYTFKDSSGDERRRSNADFSAVSLWNISRYRFSRRVSALGVLHGYQREQGTPGLASLPDESARTRSTRQLAALDLRVACGASPDSDTCSLQFVTSALAASTALTDPLREVIPAAQAWSNGDRLEQSARLSWRPFERLKLAPSVIVASDRIRAGYSGQTGALASRVLLRPALAVELGVTRSTSLLGAAAIENDSVKTSLATERSSQLTPTLRLGARSRLLEWLEARANLGHSSRVPTLGELYGISAGVHGNAALVPERGPTADVGLRVQHDWPALRLQADVFGFVRGVAELIAYRQSGPAAISPYNVGRARIAGLESALALELWSRLALNGAVTLLDPRDTTASRAVQNDILPYRSRLVAVAEAELFARPPWRFLERLSGGARWLHRSSKYADAAGLLVVPHQSIVDVYGSALGREQRLALRASVRNVFGTPEFDAIGLPLSGRSLHVSLEGRLP
jgi:vitamin B12 transporter